MYRILSMVLSITVVAASMFADENDVLRVGVKQRLEAGSREVVLRVYATPDSAVPLAMETRSVMVDSTGAFSTTLPSQHGEAWLGVSVASGKESARVRLGARPGLITIHVVTDAAITANGIVESISQGFRFPDGSVQTTAATVTGGVPSVNGVGTAVTIAGAGTNTVGTAGSTITITGAHGNQPGGTLHPAATTSVAGFLSAADKTKVDATVAYVRTVVVSPTVGSPTASGTALINALNAITGASASNPYLLKIEPGVYNIGGTQLVMKSNVDVEGSGENTTFITAARGGSTGSVAGAPDSEFRNLTLTNSAPATVHTYDANGIGNYRIRDVTINATTTNNSSARGPFADGGSALFLVNVTVTATAGIGASASVGVEAINASSMNIFHSTITAKGVTGSTGSSVGVHVGSTTCAITLDSSTVIATGEGSGNTAVSVVGPVTITNSTLRAETTTVRKALLTNASAVANVTNSALIATGGTAVDEVTGTIRIATSLVDGAVSGTPTCLGAYNATFVGLNTTCQ